VTRSQIAEIINLKSYASCPTFLRLVIVAVVLCPLTYSQKGGAKGVVEPKAIIDDIDSNGAAAVVRKLTAGNGSQWHDVIRGIEIGSPPWLDVAKKLLTATDAGRTTDLYFALSVALTRNAAGVLSMAGPDLPIEKVCSVPYIEPDEKTIRTHRTKVRTALRKVTSTELDSQKKACLSAIDH
jgi:hypothetical protein